VLSCRWCGVPTIEGYDASQAAWWVACDTLPLSLGGALAAAITGRTLYTLGFTPGGKPQIEYTVPLPHVDRGPYYADHQCHRPPQPNWRANLTGEPLILPADSSAPPPF
jgi:hypothetical protein